VARVFVYGTLRPASGHPMGRVLAHNARRLGRGAIRARRTSVGAYPAIIPDPAASWLHGEVYAVTGGRRIWSIIDRYEDCHELEPAYERRPIPVWLGPRSAGRWTVAWCYVMT